MACRGLRGATTATGNTPVEILDATRELLEALVAANDLCPGEIASAVFTATSDLNAAFPAQAARAMGWDAVPLLDAVEMAVPGSVPHCIRALIHWNTERPVGALRHVYLRGAAGLRPEWGIGLHSANTDGRERRNKMTGGQGEKMTEPQGETPHETRQAREAPKKADRTPTVAYQGEPGAYSQEAIYQHFGPDAGTLACAAFEDIFAAVEEERADYGLLPIENSQTGSIHQAYDLLLDHDLQVVGEVKYRVRHCLLAPQGTAASDIRRVRSHPQALAQVQRYLKRRGWQAAPAYDTAGAARELAAGQEAGSAALASALAGRIYGLEILEQGVEDDPDNTTRFFVLARNGEEVADGRATGRPERKYKTSLVFATAHTPGSLYRALGEFAGRGLNLSKIESRPRHNRPWHYVFYLDFEGRRDDPAVEQALVALLARAAFVKLLGSYPAAE